MAIQTIMNGVNIIEIDDEKYVINTYNESTGNIEIVNVSDRRQPFVVARIYAGITHFIVPPPNQKFDRQKNTGSIIILD